MDNKDILRRLKNNDEKAFELVFHEYFLSLRDYAEFYTSLQVAEDIVQDVFFKIWENRNTLAIHTSIKAYLYRSIHNRCIQYLRHKVVSQKHDSFEQGRLREALLMNRLFFESGVNTLFEKEIGSIVEASLKKLPEKTAHIFIMSRKEHKKNSEIARDLNLTEKSIEYHITKVLNLLRNELKDYLPLLLLLLK